MEREYDGDGAGRNLIRNYPGPGHGGREGGVVVWCGVCRELVPQSSLDIFNVLQTRAD